MPVFATSVIFGVFAVPAFSRIYHWNIPAGQYFSQPWLYIPLLSVARGHPPPHCENTQVLREAITEDDDDDI